MSLKTSSKALQEHVVAWRRGEGGGEGAACRLLIIIAVHRAGKEPVQRVIRLQKDKTSERDSHCNGTLQQDLNIGE